MPIANDYAVLSSDKKTLILPNDVQHWLKSGDRFLVVIENDGLILRRTHDVKSLDDIVKQDKAPLSNDELNSIIHESRR